jgi:hypothetical protein
VQYLDVVQNHFGAEFDALDVAEGGSGPATEVRRVGQKQKGFGGAVAVRTCSEAQPLKKEEY